MVAFAARGGLQLVDLATCRVHVVAAMTAASVRFSPDGRWLAYAHQANGNPSRLVVLPASGGAARWPLGDTVVAWSWVPTGELIYGITAGGSLVAATPTGPHRVVVAHLGAPFAGTAFVSPGGDRVALDRSTCGPRPPVGELDTVDVHTGALTVAITQAGRFFTLAGWSPDGRWLLYWVATQCSASLAADGWPLEAVPADGGTPVRAVSHMLLYEDFLTRCSQRLVAAAGPDRETELDSALVQTGPPAWRERTIVPPRALSWVSPSCAPAGHVLAAAAGPNHEAQLGLDHRSIWLLRSDGSVVRRLTSPPAGGLSDEAPRFSRDGRWILFLRTRLVSGGESTISKATIELVPTTGVGGVVPIVDFTSDDFGFYDHFRWADEIAWYQPR
jgi:dipeptidyl aminopeptidase/acylaminoacyl peptidase